MQNYLQKNFSDKKIIEEADTAQAAKDLSEGKLPPHATVIANAICAQLYGLEIAQKEIQDSKENLTLFLCAKPYKT